MNNKQKATNMGFRTLVELNHDYCPHDDDKSLLEWAKAFRLYMGAGEKKLLPYGVTFKHMRSSYAPDPVAGMGDPS